MPKFIKCSCEDVQYMGYEIKNNPINLDLVAQVSKITVKSYYDSKGKPALMFHGIEKKWIYETHQQEQRDMDYERIISNLTL